MTTKCCAYCSNLEEDLCLAHSRGYEAQVRFPFSHGKDCPDYDFDPERVEGWNRYFAEQAEQRAAEELRRKTEAEAKAKAHAEAAAKREAEAAARAAAHKAEVEAEFHEFEERVREAKAGHNDLTPNGCFLKIRKYAFRMTPEIWEQIV